jgi:L-amino acid N-acyltransferase YncA
MANIPTEEPSMSYTIRLAQPDDAAGILAIYGPHVINTSASFEYQPPSIAEMQQRISKTLQKYPWIVAQDNDSGQILGYAYTSTYRERSAYQWDAETSIYIHPDAQRRGIARQLYGLLFDISRKQNLLTLYGVVTLPNPASIQLHSAMGFQQFAIFENVGYKHGQWHHVAWMRLILSDYSKNPHMFIPFSQLDPAQWQALFDACNAAQ